MKASLFKPLINIWPPFLGAGIRVEKISQDYRQIQVCLLARWYNRNYVGTHFGGSLFAMTDPFFMLMYLHNLGKDYIVWDLEARIRFMTPGRGKVRAFFQLTEADIETAQNRTAEAGKFVAEHVISVMDENGSTVAEITKHIYIRRKSAKSKK